MGGRARMRIDSEFKVASIKTASLCGHHVSLRYSENRKHTHLVFSWNTPNILSKSPDASASRLRDCMIL
jgi:hypothetical protein